MALRKSELYGLAVDSVPEFDHVPDFDGGGPGGSFPGAPSPRWIVCAIDAASNAAMRMYCTQEGDNLHHAWLLGRVPPLADDEWLLSCFIKGYFLPAWKKAGRPQDGGVGQEIWNKAVADPKWHACRHGIMSVISACDEARWCDFWSRS